MEIALSILFFVVGLFALVKSADFLVAGASSIAAHFKVNPIVIGLTVVAFGTSAPELTVSVVSALSGNTAIALGNVIGSNIANILLILGLSALFYPLAVQRNTVWKEIPMSFLGAIVLSVLALQNLIDDGRILNISLTGDSIVGSITASNGIILLAFFIIFIYYTFGISKLTGDVEAEVKMQSLAKSIVWVLGGILGLTVGSKLLVDNAIILARAVGASESLIGLTLVAVGTSLPELVTSVTAAIKKKAEIAIGNVIGSNIFNIFFVLGVTAVIKPIPLAASMTFDIVVLFGATILLFISLFILKKHTLSRFEGSLMLGAYLTYLIFLVYRG